MNYQALKSMIDNLVKNYKCNECWSNITDNNIDIVWAAWNNVNIDIECPKCKKHAMLKSQVIQIDINNIKDLKNNLLHLKSKIENPIRDEIMIK
jgi:DNA-directed RNA polymerase subunit RPC12/RpoP